MESPIDSEYITLVKSKYCGVPLNVGTYGHHAPINTLFASKCITKKSKN